MNSEYDKIMDAIEDLRKADNKHDGRLTAVEVEMRGVHTEMRELKQDVKESTKATQELLAQFTQLHLRVAELYGSNKLLIWVLGLAAGTLTLLEAFAVFSK